MPTLPRAILAVVAALAVGFGLRQLSQGQGAGWTVPPDQVVAASPEGQAGNAASPGVITILLVPREMTILDPLLWVGTGLGAGLLVFTATKRRGPR